MMQNASQIAGITSSTINQTINNTNVILPNPRTLDEYTPHQCWLANFILQINASLIVIKILLCAALTYGWVTGYYR